MTFEKVEPSYRSTSSKAKSTFSETESLADSIQDHVAQFRSKQNSRDTQIAPRGEPAGGSDVYKLDIVSRSQRFVELVVVLSFAALGTIYFL